MSQVQILNASGPLLLGAPAPSPAQRAQHAPLLFPLPLGEGQEEGLLALKPSPLIPSSSRFALNAGEGARAPSSKSCPNSN